jgi:hypothetical protein
VGNIQACGTSATEFLTITVNGDTRTWSIAPYDVYAIQDSMPDGGFYSFHLGAYDSVSTGTVDLFLYRSEDSTTAPFGFGIEGMSIWDPLATQGMLGDYFLHELTQPARVTEYGNVGQFITGGFSGLFIQSTPSIVDTANVTVSFHIRREPY